MRPDHTWGPCGQSKFTLDLREAQFGAVLRNWLIHIPPANIY